MNGTVPLLPYISLPGVHGENFIFFTKHVGVRTIKGLNSEQQGRKKFQTS
jgi:hypothetical protein